MKPATKKVISTKNGSAALIGKIVNRMSLPATRFMPYAER
jgi:hypothetical protein